MYQRYNIRDLTTLMEIERAPLDYSGKERKRFGNFRHELKSTVIKSYFFDGYFDDAGLSQEDMTYIINGYSPVRISPTGEEKRTFTIHHIKPLVCSGETRPSNLIPLPRRFHDFLHEKVIDPQLAGLDVGEKKVLVAMPDFSKITLRMMMDRGFQIQYHKYIVDQYHMLPAEFKKRSKRNDQQQISNWYQKNFGCIK